MFLIWLSSPQCRGSAWKQVWGKATCLWQEAVLCVVLSKQLLQRVHADVWCSWQPSGRIPSSPHVRLSLERQLPRPFGSCRALQWNAAFFRPILQNGILHASVQDHPAWRVQFYRACISVCGPRRCCQTGSWTPALKKLAHCLPLDQQSAQACRWPHWLSWDVSTRSHACWIKVYITEC